MTGKDLKHITWALAEGIAVVRFKYSQFRDFEAYDEIARELDSAASADGVRVLLLKLDVLEHFTSRLLGIMAALSKRLREAGKALAVCRVRPEPLRTFRLCKLDTIIPVYATEEEATAALST